MVRLLVCDDSPEARAAIRAVLEGTSEIEIVGEAADGEEAVRLASALEPDVVLMDVGMPVLGGVEATRRIRERVPRARVVAFTGAEELDVVMAMMEAGASEYCVKGSPLWELERAVVGADDPLLRLAHGLARSMRTGGAADIVANELAELAGASLASVYVARSDDVLVPAGAAGPGASLSPHTPPSVAFRSFVTGFVADADADELAEFYKLGLACSDVVAAPLRADGDALGVVVVAMPESTQRRVDRKLLASVADLAAASITNERRLAHTFAEARRDALTGLANRRAFDEELARAVAGGGPVAVALSDLDGFKRVNDTEGHSVGDAVLRELGRVLLRSLRIDEEVFRIGGDEFAFVIAGDSHEAARVAERLRRALARQRRGHALPTLSVGIASLPAEARTHDELVRRADAALYAAKWAGRDRVVVYSGEHEAVASAPRTPAAPVERAGGPLRLLVVDDDAALRLLLRTTFEVVDVVVEEAESAVEAERAIVTSSPDVMVLDVGLPGLDGLEFCRKLRRDPRTRDLAVVLLTGSDEVTEVTAEAAGADALLRKPFSPIELLGAVERLAGGLADGPFHGAAGKRPEEQLLLYAQDLRRLLEIERRQRVMLQRAYRQTVAALASALDSKDAGTREHSERVRRYAAELARAVEPTLLDDLSLEYGFLLHDVGKIGVPERILHKPGPLTQPELRLMQRHPVVGEQMLGEVALLQGEGLRVVRHHHERWDGRGYPDGLAGPDIPLGARIFAVADALDAITSDRPYRAAGAWDQAVAEILSEAELQFDPGVVDAFRRSEPTLRAIHHELIAG